MTNFSASIALLTGGRTFKLILPNTQEFPLQQAPSYPL